MSRTVQLGNRKGEFLEVPLQVDGDREVSALEIDGVLYHLERIRHETLCAEYRIDNDPDYEPASTPDGYCYIIIPFSKI